MKLFSASALSLSIVQFVSSLLVLVGLWMFDYNTQSVLTSVFFYFLYTGVGISMMFHRYWTHKSFEFRIPFLKWIFTWFGLMAGRGSVLGWVHVHREHHAFSDTDRDPHAPNIFKWRVFFPFMLGYGNKINKRLIRDLLDKKQLFINDWYMLLILSWVILLAVIDPWLAYFGWALPVAVAHLVLNAFTYFGHSVGYRNHQHRDDSRNLWPFGIFLWGEGWHNNHHKNPKNWNLQEKWWELDLIAPVIYLVKK